jgi:hypothetical protein
MQVRALPSARAFPASCILHPVSRVPRVRVFRRRAPDTGFQVPGTWHLGPGTRYRINAEDRTPSTEDRAKRAHRVCILYPVSGPDSRVHAWGNGRGRTRGPMTLEGGLDPLKLDMQGTVGIMEYPGFGFPHCPEEMHVPASDGPLRAETPAHHPLGRVLSYLYMSLADMTLRLGSARW